jgi:hypothetical protein
MEEPDILADAFNRGAESQKNHDTPSRETIERLVRLEVNMQNIPDQMKVAINEAMEVFWAKLKDEFLKDYGDRISALEKKINWAWAFGAGAAAVVTIVWNVFFH